MLKITNNEISRGTVFSTCTVSWESSTTLDYIYVIITSDTESKSRSQSEVALHTTSGSFTVEQLRPNTMYTIGIYNALVSPTDGDTVTFTTHTYQPELSFSEDFWETAEPSSLTFGESKKGLVKLGEEIDSISSVQIKAQVDVTQNLVSINNFETFEVNGVYIEPYRRYFRLYGKATDDVNIVLYGDEDDNPRIGRLLYVPTNDYTSLVGTANGISDSFVYFNQVWQNGDADEREEWWENNNDKKNRHRFTCSYDVLGLTARITIPKGTDFGEDGEILYSYIGFSSVIPPENRIGDDSKVTLPIFDTVCTLDTSDASNKVVKQKTYTYNVEYDSNDNAKYALSQSPLTNVNLISEASLQLTSEIWNYSYLLPFGIGNIKEALVPATYDQTSFTVTFTLEVHANDINGEDFICGYQTRTIPITTSNISAPIATAYIGASDSTTTSLMGTVDGLDIANGAGIKTISSKLKIYIKNLYPDTVYYYGRSVNKLDIYYEVRGKTFMPFSKVIDKNLDILDFIKNYRSSYYTKEINSADIEYMNSIPSSEVLKRGLFIYGIDTTGNKTEPLYIPFEMIDYHAPIIQATAERVNGRADVNINITSKISTITYSDTSYNELKNFTLAVVITDSTEESYTLTPASSEYTITKSGSDFLLQYSTTITLDNEKSCTVSTTITDNIQSKIVSNFVDKAIPILGIFDDNIVTVGKLPDETYKDCKLQVASDIAIDYNGSTIEIGKLITELKNKFLDMTYPVGSLYWTHDSTQDPNTLFGGTWEQSNSQFVIVTGVQYADHFYCWIRTA